MMIVLNEPYGEFDPVVREKTFKPPNLFIGRSKSGKLTNALMREFVEVLYYLVDQKACFVVYSRSGHEAPGTFKFRNSQRKLAVKYIPQGATSFMQPLNVYAFHKMKDFVKRLMERLKMEGAPVTPYHRDTILKMESPMLNQFQSPLFYPRFRYAWHKSGFPVNQVRFGIIGFSNPSHFLPAFLRCSWLACRKNLCLKCFFNDYHIHRKEPVAEPMEYKIFSMFLKKEK